MKYVINNFVIETFSAIYKIEHQSSSRIDIRNVVETKRKTKRRKEEEKLRYEECDEHPSSRCITLLRHIDFNRSRRKRFEKCCRSEYLVRMKPAYKRNTPKGV